MRVGKQWRQETKCDRGAWQCAWLASWWASCGATATRGAPLLAMQADIDKLRAAGEGAAMSGAPASSGGKNPDDIFNRYCKPACMAACGFYQEVA